MPSSLPTCPPPLLPARWPREHAHDLFGERHAHWHAAAQQHFTTLEAAAPTRTAA